MLIRRWAPEQDDFPAPVAPSVVDDGSDWWGGAMQCAATLALAVSLSANALSAQIAGTVRGDSNDLPIAAAPLVTEDAWLPPIPGPSRAVAAFIDEANDVLSVPVGVAAQDEWQPRIPAPTPSVAAFIDGGNDLPRSLGVDDEPGFAPRIPQPPATPPVLAWRDDESAAFGPGVAGPAVYYVVGAVTAIERSLTCSALQRSLTVTAIERPLSVSAIERPLPVTAIT